MELDRYRALVCAIETGSLSAAAEALQYTPSGVSRMVAALEEETGVPLLLREHSGVRPTKECEKLLPAIRDLLHAGESCAQLSAQLRGLDVGTVTVGTAYSAFYSPLARIILDFHARYGGIQVQLRGGYSTELITQLNTHQLDLCFISLAVGSGVFNSLASSATTCVSGCTVVASSLSTSVVELLAARAGSTWILFLSKEKGI